MDRQVFAAEIILDEIPSAVRAQIAGSKDLIQFHLRKLSLITDEAFIVTSPNRFSVYIIYKDISPLNEFFSMFSGVKGYVQYYFNTEESITHLFAFASGLLSPIKGDHDVLVQLEEAHALARQCNSIGITLDNLLREASYNGKRVRTYTGIDKFSSSVVDVGIELLYSRIEGLHHKKFLVIGTGKIARLALKYLYNEGIQSVRVVSNDSVRAQQLAQLYYCESGTLQDLHQYVKESDVIIGGTHYEVSLFPESLLSGFFEPKKKWFILDFGMPRNFNEKLSEKKYIEIYNLDDLKRLHKSPLDAFGGVEAAWKMVMGQAKAFFEVLAQLEFSPVLVAYWNRVMYLKNKELNVLLPKLDESLSDADVENIKSQARKLLQQMSGNTTSNLRRICNNFQAEDASKAVRDIKDFKSIKLNISLN